MLIGAYFAFFLLIFGTTKAGRTFEDLILHEEVPELVYLQTRKLLRDTHYKRAEKRRQVYWQEEDLSPKLVRRVSMLHPRNRPLHLNTSYATEKVATL